MTAKSESGLKRPKSGSGLKGAQADNVAKEARSKSVPSAADQDSESGLKLGLSKLCREETKRKCWTRSFCNEEGIKVFSHFIT